MSLGTAGQLSCFTRIHVLEARRIRPKPVRRRRYIHILCTYMYTLDYRVSCSQELRRLKKARRSPTSDVYEFFLGRLPDYYISYAVNLNPQASANPGSELSCWVSEWPQAEAFHTKAPFLRQTPKPQTESPISSDE